MLLELRILREVYVTLFQLSYELRELFRINGQQNEESTGVNVYLLLMQLLKACKQDLKHLVNKIEDANWYIFIIIAISSFANQDCIPGLIMNRKSGI